MFTNRQQAAQLLAEKIKQKHINLKNTVIVSLPKGGVVVGGGIAALLNLPHKVIISKKITQPGAPELAIGALSLSKKSLFLNEQLIKELSISQKQIEEAMAVAKEKVEKQKSSFNEATKINFSQKTVILTDDGAATGATLIAAIKHILHQKPKKIIVALPVAPPETVKKLKNLVNQVIVLQQPELFFSVSQFYHSFPQISLKEAKAILKIS